MSSKIYVGGLPYATTDAQLQEIFSAHGAVESARVITDKFTGVPVVSVLSRWPTPTRRRKRFKRSTELISTAVILR